MTAGYITGVSAANAETMKVTVCFPYDAELFKKLSEKVANAGAQKSHDVDKLVVVTDAPDSEKKGQQRLSWSTKFMKVFRGRVGD